MIRIETFLAPDLKPINGDLTQIIQLLLNLANNAVDAMPEGGRLLIEAKNVFLDDSFTRRHREVPVGEYVLLRVSDTGKGMDARTQEQIFNPFFTTKDVGKGTGLGLSMAYGIVKGHEGHISCSSEEGRGTTFNVYLPAHRDYLGSPSSGQEAIPEIRGGRETILLVDDEAVLRDLGEETLVAVGYAVITAGSGEEALEVYQARGGGIDLVVLDLGMPGMGGKRCLQEILSLNPRAKVLITSGYSIVGLTDELLSLGARGFVPKPFRRQDLLATIRNLLDDAERGPD
jgi:CheY-like chemotaxis protein